MHTYHIHLKSGSIITLEAQRIDFPDSKSETLQIHISATKTDTDNIVLTSEVAAIVHVLPSIGGFAQA
jgi:hypothetical protein